jgi:hypothetical protein
VISTKDCQAAQSEIARLFLDQCRDGAQTADVAPAASCGQFLNELSRTHKGIHGSAAAIRVLGATPSAEARALSCRLLSYVDERFGVEAEGSPPAGTHPGSVAQEADSRNVIKLSETLFALKYIPVSECDAHPLANRLASIVGGAVVDGRGWTYFTDDQTTEHCDPIPTAYAVRALASHGQTPEGPIRYLFAAIAAESTVDLFAQVLCLFVLTFLPAPAADLSRDRVLGDALMRQWRRLSSLLAQNLEANVEYLDVSAETNYYVRIPWQLYLLAVAARLKPLRLFASVIAQRRISGILADISSKNGFTYPHSGRRVSSRTSGIIFDILDLIAEELDKHRFMVLANPMLGMDHLRRSRSVRWLTICAVIAAIGLSIAEWLALPNRNLSEVAPELVAGLLIALLFAVGTSGT